MFNSAILDVAVGLIFVYLVLSLICTSVNEAIAQWLNMRAENLVDTIHGMFTGPDAHVIADRILNHDLVLSTSYTRTKAVGADGQSTSEVTKNPSYLESNVFSLALTGLLGFKEPACAGTSLQAQFDNAPYDGDTLKVLQPMIAGANNDLDTARKNIETWYDSVMQRASGWYKRRIQIIGFFVAAGVVIVCNADTLMISNTLLSNQVALQSTVNVAKGMAGGQPATASQPSGGQAASAQPSLPTLTPTAKQAAMSLIGWSNTPGEARALPQSGGDWGRKILGLLITIFAASLGAPFWFDALNKIMNIRSAGASPVELDAKTKPGDPGRIPHTKDDGGDGDSEGNSDASAAKDETDETTPTDPSKPQEKQK